MEDVQANMETIAVDAIGVADLTNTATRLAALAALGVARGTATIDFGGTTSGSVTVSHGLTSAPTAAVVGSVQGAIGVNASFSCGSFTATQMTIYGYAQSAPGGPFVVSWVVVL